MTGLDHRRRQPGQRRSVEGQGLRDGCLAVGRRIGMVVQHQGGAVEVHDQPRAALGKTVEEPDGGLMPRVRVKASGARGERGGQEATKVRDGRKVGRLDGQGGGLRIR